jgi:hypothetical protein
MLFPACFKCGKRSFKLLLRRETNRTSPSRTKHIVLHPSHFGSKSQLRCEKGLGTSIGNIGSRCAGIAAGTAAGCTLLCLGFFEAAITQLSALYGLSVKYRGAGFIKRLVSGVDSVRLPRGDRCQGAGIAHSATCSFLRVLIYRVKYRDAVAV